MGAVSMLALLVTHPLEFRTLLQYYLWHDQRDVSAPHDRENTGWDRQSMQRCWYFLDQTSRSFAAVIKQLEGDLARVVSLTFRSFSVLARMGNGPTTCPPSLYSICGAP